MGEGRAGRGEAVGARGAPGSPPHTPPVVKLEQSLEEGIVCSAETGRPREGKELASDHTACGDSQPEEAGRKQFSCCQAPALICCKVLGNCPKSLVSILFLFVFNKTRMMGVWCEISCYRNSLNQTSLVPKLLLCFKSGAHGCLYPLNL